jgi:hypothetical protein
VTGGARARVLQALAAGGVRYIVVGGVAVVLHGHLRATLDLDLVLDLEPGNTARALAILDDLGFVPVVPVAAAAFADPAIRASWKRDRNMLVFSMWQEREPGFKVDLFVEPPFEFEQAWQRSVVAKVGDAAVRVVSLADLIDMKRQAGRAQDLADVEALERLGE